MRAMYRPALAALVLAAAYSPADAEPAGGGAAGVPEVVSAPRATLEAMLPGAPPQALLRDKATGVYQVVRVGDPFLGYRVSQLGVDQIVLTSAVGTNFVLPLVTAPAPAPAVVPPPPVAADAAQDPYADATPDVAPDPY